MMNMIMTRKILNLIPALACIILASCSGQANFADGDTQKRNEVKMIRIPFMITFDQKNASLSKNAIDQLDNFMMKVNISYGDEISLDLPLQRDGKLSEENVKRMTFLSNILKERGLHLSPEVTPYGMSPAEGQARLLISRYTVIPPTCGDWSIPSNDNYGNAATANFGCANQASLGLMVANPRDLITGENNTTPYTENAAKAIYTYKTKKPTSLSSITTKKKK
ncbi:MAG: CpaD family pilus assembly protein [Emcibacter sp.]|nr:CpaD family pilus assembly protein [Emcibacter sp.]